MIELPCIEERHKANLLLVLQASEGNNFDTIRTSISHFTSGDNHQQVRLTQLDLLFSLIMFLHESFDFFQMLRTLFYLPAT